MDREAFSRIEQYMKSCALFSSHDELHSLRVLYLALDIADHEGGADLDILIPACLLHDIGRNEQKENPTLCHAQVGSKKAEKWLLCNGWDKLSALKIAECVLTHRFRSDHQPDSLEAKILFDSDKLDVCGALGIARTLYYGAELSEPLYDFLPDGSISDGTDGIGDSFVYEYKFKLERICESLYTKRAKEIGILRRKAAASFYNELLREANESYGCGRGILESFLSS
ncbi:MAG: HD domain-containing protein [Clostridiales bacterium]|jgi:uncharacterized protein|nr:HD domain-containing protein [Clostridiales bacterium]